MVKKIITYTFLVIVIASCGLIKPKAQFYDSEAGRQFADKHFNYKVWKGWHDWTIDSTDIYLNDPIISFDVANALFFTVILSEDSNGNVIKNSNYYESIGRWQLFTQGWDDVDTLLGAFITSCDSPRVWGDKCIALNTDSFPYIDDTQDWTTRMPWVTVDTIITEPGSPDSGMVDLNPRENYWFGYSQNQEIYTNGSY